MISHDLNLEALRRTANIARRLGHIRPTLLVSPILSHLSVRRIVEWQDLKLFIDPTSHLGQSIIFDRTYEPETVEMFRDNIGPGDIVLDIGANEGFFSSLAASLVGSSGTVIAVEPQHRLLDALEINLALNSRGRYHVLPNVIAERDGEETFINLFPMSNTGASSIVSPYKLGAKKQPTKTINPDAIISELNLSHFNFVKIDVEGFEPEVIRSFANLASSGVVYKILLDYHQDILKSRGIDARDTHELLKGFGFRSISGSIGAGYVLYAI